MATKTQQELEIVMSAKGVANVERDMVRVSAAAKKMEGGFLKSLKGQFGEESALGSWMKVAKGAGAVAALSMVTGKMREFADVLVAVDANGKMTFNTTKALGSILERLPIAGDLYAIATIKTRKQHEAMMKQKQQAIADQAEYASQAKQIAAQIKAANAQAGSMADQAAMLGVKGFDAERAAAMSEYNKAFEESLRLQSEAMRKGEDAKLKQASQLLEENAGKLYARRTEDIAARELKAAKDAARALADTTEDGEREIARIKGESAERQAQIRGDGLDAELAAIRRKTDQEVEVVQAAAKRASRDSSIDFFGASIPALAGTVGMVQAVRKGEALREGGALSEEEARKRNTERTRAADREMNAIRQADAERRAEEGDQVARLKAEQYRVNSRFTGEMDKIESIIDNPAASKGQKAEARKMLAASAEARIKAIEQVRLIDEVQLTGFSSSRFMTGAAQRAREEGRDVTAAERSAKSAEETAKGVQTLIDIAGKIAALAGSSDKSLVVKIGNM